MRTGAQTDFQDQLRGLSTGAHMCLVFEKPEDQWAAMMPVAIGAFERGLRLSYITDDRSIEEVSAAMHAAGIDVAENVRRRALVFATKRDAYLRSGCFDPHAMIRHLRELTQQALDEGFNGYCVTGEMTWALGDECGCERLIEYEALLNDFFPGSRASAVCQYHRSRFARRSSATCCAPTRWPFSATRSARISTTRHPRWCSAASRWTRASTG